MDQYDDFDDPDSVVVDNQSYTSGLPSYSEVQIEQPPPPSYEDAVDPNGKFKGIIKKDHSNSNLKIF